MDTSIKKIVAKHPDIEIIALEKNLGFAGGFNIGIKYCINCGAEFIFIINNDTVCDPDMLINLFLPLKNCRCITGPEICYFDKKEKIWSMGGDLNKITLEVKKSSKKVFMNETIIKRDFLTACALLIPKEVFGSIGLFDEHFFLYYEDRDFGMRLNKAEIPQYLVPKAIIWHKVSVSSDGSDSENERYWMARSSVVFFKRYAKKFQIPIIFFWRFCSALKTSYRLLFRNRILSFKAYWRGLKDGIFFKE